MEFSVIIAILGALGTGGTVTAAFSNWRQRKDKREERQATRDEAYRDQLRHAYAEFISAYSKFLDAGGLMHSINRAIDELPGEVYTSAVEEGAGDGEAQMAAANAVTPALRERARRAVEDFATASSDANTKAVAVLLIDDDEQRRERMLALANAQLQPPQSVADYDRFQADLRALRARLDELTVSLGGGFSPDRWHREIAERRALPIPAVGALPAPQDRSGDARSLPAPSAGTKNDTRE